MKNQILSEEFRRMQKLAGLINESQLSEEVKVTSKEFGGYDDSEFLKIAWKMSIDDLEKLLLTSIDDLKWLKKNFKGTLGLFHKRDAQIITNRIKFINQIIASKNKNPDFIPDHYK